MGSNCRIIVVGAGNAALVSALSAHDAGADVKVIEAASEDEMGGNSRFTLGGFRFGFEKPDEVLALVGDNSIESRRVVIENGYTADDFFMHLRDYSRMQADTALCRLLADKSLEAVTLLSRLGVEWKLSIDGFEDEQMWSRAPGNLYATGRGKGLIERLLRATRERGMQIEYSTSLQDVVFDGGRLKGIVVSTSEGRREFLKCRACIFGCGGFEANREMRRHHMGELWANMRVRGTRFNQGAGLRALMRIGARKAGQWGNGHSVPVDSCAPDYGSLALGETTRRCLFQYGVTVNSDSHRFMDEGEDLKWFMYSTTGLKIASQVGGCVYQIFDATLEAANFEKDFYLNSDFKTADTLESLAEAVGIPAVALSHEVDVYNRAIVDKSRFSPGKLDGSSTQGLEIPRSNFASEISQPPFYAFPVVAGITFTYGGIGISENCEVQDEDRRPLLGIYAAGEMAGGFFATNYPANSGLSRGAVTGMVSGRSAAEFALR